ncbi:SAM domain-containing protein SAMSN-1b isoform X2 [Dicentrarchus labrax]|uniref:SAM domain-containing protein SAMSN-1b isoform X2 n=1 Tax=Dicentrarchus labrax TaxID=13489 RepID=UPI0021F55550|nr:SAM domain-containing protein SAMSN-1b isoform X2 [Dicentrarchus labrax]
MNLFCFTLEGSTESIYEPAYSQTLKEVLPKYQCSPALRRRKPEWGGSDPSINSDRPQSTIKVNQNNRRSCVPTSPIDNDTLDKDINHACWMSSGNKKDLCHQIKVQNGEMCKALCHSSVLTRDDRVKDPSCDRTHLPAQGGETAADTAESIHATGRLKKLQNLVQMKKEHQSGAGKGKSTSESNDLANVLSNNNPVLTCIGLGKRTEKKSPKSPPQQQQQAKYVHEDSEEEGVWSPRLGNYLWSPFECPQPWSPFYHTCHQPQHELWVCGGTLTLPRRTEWDRFESLIQELDSKQPDLSPPQTACSITDLEPLQNTQKQEQDGDPTKLRLQRRETETSSHSDRKHVKASPEKMLTSITNGKTQRDEAVKREVGGGRRFTSGHRRSSNSLESLYSLNSGQSSSSGVTSGSDCSSNRDSLRLEDDLLCTRQFCGRARVHTDFVPSPYDTESLKLKVGDVIDIFAKPPMGIWTGMLNGRMGNFKFIYVDVLTEESPDAHEETQTHRVRQKSTVQEVLRRLSLEEYSSSLQLNGYQTVDDLIKLREHHLTELNVTDPEHRHRLLAAVDSLQQLRSDSQLENEANQEAETPSENMRADMNNCPRDSGCHMPSDSPDNSTEDTDLHFISEYPLPAETTAS